MKRGGGAFENLILVSCSSGSYKDALPSSFACRNSKDQRLRPLCRHTQPHGAG